MALDGSCRWVTNGTGESVTEVNASDGSWVQTVSGCTYGFNGSGGVAFDGSHIWLTNNLGNSVSEISSH